MPPLDDKDQVSNPSDDTDLDDAIDPNAEPDADEGASGDAGYDADGAASSDAHGDNEDEGALGIVRDVVSQRPDSEAASPADGQNDGSNPDGQGSQTPKEQDDENYSDVPFHKHPRFQHLLRKAKSNEADAVRYRNVQAFLDDNGISPERAAELLSIQAEANRDPVKAWQMVKPLVQELLVAAGEVLPPELAQRVQNGEMSREAAADIARANARAAAVENGRTFEQQRDANRRAHALAQACHSAAVEWEKDRFDKDPNFAAKQQSLLKEVAYLQKIEGVPNTPEGVRDQLNRAYKEIPAPAAARPAPAAPTVGQAGRAKPSAGGSASRTAQPKPQTTLDIIRQVRAKSRAG